MRLARLVVLVLFLGLGLPSCGDRVEENEGAEPAGGDAEQVEEPQVEGDQVEKGQVEERHVEEDLGEEHDAESELVHDFAPIPLSRMIGMAELAVLGRVEALREDTYEFRVSEVVIGKTEEPSIAIHKYRPMRFEGRQRTAPYAIGQTFLVFLTHETKDPLEGPWRTLGLGGEGEMPVEAGYVYFPGLFLKGWERRPYVVHGVERTIQRHLVDSFLEVVKAYRECFVWVPAGNKLEPRRVADDAELEAFRERGRLAAELVRQTLSKIPRR